LTHPIHFSYVIRSKHGDQPMPLGSIIVYGADWCGDCRRAKRFLNEHNIHFSWIDIEHDKEGEQFVLKVNKGMRSIPTIVFEDGSILVEPSDRTISEKLSHAILPDASPRTVS
jgi:glutaredoxin-like protein